VRRGPFGFGSGYSGVDDFQEAQKETIYEMSLIVTCHLSDSVNSQNKPSIQRNSHTRVATSVEKYCNDQKYSNEMEKELI
jgi:hypothetical protein